MKTKFNIAFIVILILAFKIPVFSQLDFLNPFKDNFYGFTIGSSYHYTIGPYNNSVYRMTLSLKYGPFYFGRDKIDTNYQIKYEIINKNKILNSKKKDTIDKVILKTFEIHDSFIKEYLQQIILIPISSLFNKTILIDTNTVDNRNTEITNFSIEKVLDTNKSPFSFSVHFGYAYYYINKLIYEKMNSEKIFMGGIFVTAIFPFNICDNFHLGFGSSLNLPSFTNSQSNFVNDTMKFKVATSTVYSPEIFFVSSISCPNLGLSVFLDFGWQFLLYPDLTYSALSEVDKQHLTEITKNLPNQLNLSNLFLHAGISITLNKKK